MLSLYYWAVLAILFCGASADSFTGYRDSDDLVRVLKAYCGSARLLLTTAASNNMKAPYSISKGQAVNLPCQVACTMETYSGKYVFWVDQEPISRTAIAGITNADACKNACKADSTCKMSDWEFGKTPLKYGCFFYTKDIHASKLQFDYGFGFSVFIKRQTNL